MSSVAPNGGVVAPASTPRVVEEKDAPNSEVPEKPLDSKDETPASKHVAESEGNQTPDKGSGKEESAEKMVSEEMKPEPTVSKGEKREHDEASSGSSDDKSAAESTAKKQKINGESNNDNEESATKKPDTETAEKPAEAGDPPAKRGPGRPKKADGNKKAAKKQPTPRSTEGIGSRTRSRAKAQA